MEHFTPYASLVGGVLIGISATLMLLLFGRVAGISGIVHGAFALKSAVGERAWRVTFLVGMLAGGAVMMLFLPEKFALGVDRSLPAVTLAGLLVGFGTRMGGGCTSGHGVCGISRLAPRSMVATVTFMVTGAATVLLINRLWEGSV